MRMKSLVFSLLLLLLPLASQAAERRDSLAATDTASIETRYDRHVARYRHRWESLIPRHTVMQYAGNMGLISMGMGWEHGHKKHWETQLLFGILPKYDSKRVKLTMTLKENYIPWHVALAPNWQLDPLTCSIYLNTVFGGEFWNNQPDRYPDDYYPLLRTALRANIALGQRVTWLVPRSRRKFVKAITAFYEVGTCDLYIRAMVVDNYVSLWDILGLSLGLRMQVF